MSASHYQRTLASTVAVSGFGFFGGRDVQVAFHPAGVGEGIVFVRTDLGPSCRVPAGVAFRIESPRRTTLAAGPVRVEMIEHVMAALAGLGIDNCLVHVDQAEMPGMDGSSQPFVEVLDQAGQVDQAARRDPLVVRETVRVEDGTGWIEARPAAEMGLELEYRLDYAQSGSVGRQTFRQRVTPDTFRSELAPSRTFLLKEEADALLAMGLGERVSPRDVLVFGPDGPIENRLRFTDECARHKMLDLVGDLALAGRPVVGSITACRSGHRLNAELVRALLARQAARPDWRRSA